MKNIPLSCGKGGEVGPSRLHRGQKGMVVAHLGVVHHLGGVGGVFPGEAQHPRRHSTQIRNLFRHVR